MEIWERIGNLRNGINGGVEPLDNVQLPTRTVKISLGVFMIQSVMIALWWSIKDGVFYPWVLLFSSVLEVGWLWNKVTDSWKRARGRDYERLYDETEATLATEPVDPPTIIIHNTGITQPEHINHPLQLSSEESSE